MWALLAALALVLLWVPVTRAVHRHTLPDDEPADVSHALPWASVTAWLLAAYLTCQSWQFYSALAWLAPTYESTAGPRGTPASSWRPSRAPSWSPGLAAPTLLDRVPDARVLLVVGGGARRLRELGVWLAPDAAPWLWALLLGAGQGAAFALGLVLLVRYAVTPRDSARLTAMAFLVSYTVAATGPAVTGLWRTPRAASPRSWAALALVMVPQLLVSLRLHPRLEKVGSGSG